MKKSGGSARKYVVKGRVQGVGFRAFVQDAAESLGVRGWAGNRGDGSVEVYAIGTPEQLSELSGYLWKGPRMADVRHVDEMEAAVEDWNDFQVRY
jgi:acylphosphatase